MLALFVYFLQAHAYVQLLFTENYLLLLYVPFLLLGSKLIKSTVVPLSNFNISVDNKLKCYCNV